MQKLQFPSIGAVRLVFNAVQVTFLHATMAICVQRRRARASTTSVGFTKGDDIRTIVVGWEWTKIRCENCLWGCQ